eukprot:393664-Pleurochrysis_carterae.AAC.4
MNDCCSALVAITQPRNKNASSMREHYSRSACAARRSTSAHNPTRSKTSSKQRARGRSTLSRSLFYTNLQIWEIDSNEGSAPLLLHPRRASCLA